MTEEQAASKQEVARLRNELYSIQEEVDLLRSRIAKWGVSGANELFSGHGFQEFADGNLRLDRTGIQIRANDNTGVTSLRFVEDWTQSPDLEALQARVYGANYNDFAAFVTLLAEADGTVDFTALADTSVIAETSALTRIQATNDTAGTGASIVVEATTTDPRIELDCTVIRASTGYFRVPVRGSDPITLEDGATWYRTDTDKFRGRVNGASVNLATEGYTLPIASVATLLSATFAIDSTGVKTITTAHGLASAPSIQDVQLTVTEDSNVDDWAFNLLKVESVDATNVVAKINVSTASATGGATAKLAILVIIGA